jgi:hypothetical protein
MESPDQTLDIPPSALRKRKLTRKHLLVAAGGLLLMGLTVLITILLMPAGVKAEPIQVEPIAQPTVELPKEVKPEPVKEVEKPAPAKAEATEKVAFKVYLSPSQENDLVAGLKLTLFKKELSVKKDLDFGFLRDLVQHVKVVDKE